MNFSYCYCLLLVTLLCFVPSTSGFFGSLQRTPRLPTRSQSLPGRLAALAIVARAPKSREVGFKRVNASSAFSGGVGTLGAEVVDANQNETTDLSKTGFPVRLFVNGHELSYKANEWNHESLWKHFKKVGFMENTICFYALNGKELTYREDMDTINNLLVHVIRADNSLILHRCHNDA